MPDEADLWALLERDQGLPGKCFTDPAFFELERKAVFRDSWMCIGLAADVPRNGDVCAVSILNHPLLMVRDGTQLRVFHNVCSHRGAMLVSQASHCPARIVCPYHSWAYKLNGELASTPHVGGAGQHSSQTLRRSELDLRGIRCAEWAGHVFVNLSGDATEFSDWIRPADERLRSVDWSKLRRDANLSSQVEVLANWKIICENFVESYHLPAVHRGLNQVNPMETHYQILGGHSYLGQGGTGYQGEHASLGALPTLDGMVFSKYDSLNVFPNLIIAPLADITFSIILIPQSAERTLERIEFFFVGDEALAEQFKEARCRSAAFSSQVNTEDIGIVEAVQRGRQSPAFSGGHFAIAQEATSLQFQKMVAARIVARNGQRPEDVVSLETRDIPHPRSV